jgi:hypothetical protein
MPSVSVAYVKNIMNRRISEVLDPSPNAKERKQLRGFFQSRCAFCGEKLGKVKGDTHFDHLVAASAGGSSGLANRVVACNRCNVEEKRDTDWELFLRAKCPDNQTFAARHQLILDWQKRSAVTDMPVPTGELLEAINRAKDTVTQFEHDCRRIADSVQRQRSA